MSEAAWLVGYYPLPEQTPQIGASDITVGTVTYALRHTTTALSLIDTIAAELTATYGGGYSVVIQRDRLVRITLGSAGVIQWGAATILRDILGFTGDRGSATSHVANYPSPLLWSAGYPATPSTIEGVTGYTVSHQSRYKSDDGTQNYVAHYGDEIWNELNWAHILPERMRVTGTTVAQGGTFHQFYEHVGKYGRRFFWYPDIDEDDASSTAVTWTTGYGPYAMREAEGGWYQRNVPNAEIGCSLELPIHILAELS